MRRRQPFTFWQIQPDGSAHPFHDEDAINAGTAGQVFGSIEGAIINGGVQACAFTRKTERLFDAAAWLKTGQMVEVESMDVVTITAKPKEV
jgi:hypothetical protein